jgi:hypothetical protein
MKTKKLISLLIVLSVFMWSCTTKTDLSSTTLKSSLDQSVKTLSTALNVISSSDGYQVLTTPSSTTSSGAPSFAPGFDLIDSTYTTISLSDIRGVYDYNKSHGRPRWEQGLSNFFTKTASDSSKMIVRLPAEKVKKPWLLFHFAALDTTLTNDYVFSLSKYKYSFNRFLGWNYDMASNINIKNVDAGNLSIQSSSSKTAGYHFASQFDFTNGYTANCSFATGDTAVSTYTISQSGNVLYQEQYTSVKSTTNRHFREKQYALTIGNVKIVRTPGPNSLDSAKVYVGGVLQTNAKVEIVDSVADSSEVSVTNHNREIKITFDDGTSSTISQLLGTSVQTIRNLFADLRQSYFATGIVDRIAWEVYWDGKK